MKSNFYHICALIIVLFFLGCQSASTRKISPAAESSREIYGAVGQVAGALTGKTLSEAQKKKLTKDIQKDKQAQSALESIAGAMDIKKTGVKYCPIDGKRFSFNQNVCPEHQVTLETLVD